MAENTKIEWANHSWNYWTGCEHISPACDHCYAASWAKRAGRDFAERRLTTEANRRQPLKWERNAEAFEREHGHRQRIFVNSLADVFDNQVPQAWRDELFAMIRQTPSLDYLLLTKRIGNAKHMLPVDWGDGYPNVKIGATMVTQDELRRDVLKLLRTPARGHFVSIEPMLEVMSLRHIHVGELPDVRCTQLEFDALTGAWSGRAYGTWDKLDMRASLPEILPAIDWVIVGGESGPGARPMNPAWAEALRDQCANADVPFFMKQLGGVRDKRGEHNDMPENLRVREFPR